LCAYQAKHILCVRQCAGTFRYSLHFKGFFKNYVTAGDIMLKGHASDLAPLSDVARP